MAADPAAPGPGPAPLARRARRRDRALPARAPPRWTWRPPPRSARRSCAASPAAAPSGTTRATSTCRSCCDRRTPSSPPTPGCAASPASTGSSWSRWPPPRAPSACRGVRATERDLVVDRPDGTTAKLSGVAAWLGGRALLVHGTLLVDADLDALARACAGPGAPGDPRWERTKSRRATVTSHRARAAPRVRRPAPSPAAVDLAVLAAFGPTASSRRRGRSSPADRLLADRYADPAWHADPDPPDDPPRRRPGLAPGLRSSCRLPTLAACPSGRSRRLTSTRLSRARARVRVRVRAWPPRRLRRSADARPHPGPATASP